MSMSLVGYGLMANPRPNPEATVMSLYKYAPPTPSPNTPSPQPMPQLSLLGSTNGGKLAGPPQPPHGPAIPRAAKLNPGGGF